MLYLVLDTETTGLPKVTPDDVLTVVEFAAVTLELHPDGTSTIGAKQYHAGLHPRSAYAAPKLAHPSAAKGLEINGYMRRLDALRARGVPLLDHPREFFPHLGTTFGADVLDCAGVLAWNARFDRDVLTHVDGASWATPFGLPWACAMKASAYLGNVGGRNGYWTLDKGRDQAAVATTDADKHTALADATDAARVLAWAWSLSVARGTRLPHDVLDFL